MSEFYGAKHKQMVRCKRITTKSFLWESKIQNQNTEIRTTIASALVAMFYSMLFYHVNRNSQFPVTKRIIIGNRRNSKTRVQEKPLFVNSTYERGY